MRILSITLALLMLLACGEDESTPDDESSDAASEGDTGDQVEDAGSDADNGSDAAGPPEMPQLVLSGALTETIENIAPASSWSKAQDQGTLIHLPSGAGEILAGFTFTFSGPPEEGEIYDQARSGLSCALTAMRTSDNAIWDATHGIQREADQGSCSFTLTSVEETLDTDALKQYKVHGRVEGTLPPKEGSGAEGSVTLHATF